MDAADTSERTVRAGIDAIRQAGTSAAEAVRRAREVGRRYRAERDARGGARRVVVGCWDLCHNAAGRALILAGLHAAVPGVTPTPDVEILGFCFPRSGKGLWEPMRSLAWPPVHALEVTDHADLPRRIVDLVLDHPCDLVHLSKPRMPNVLLGLAARAIWGATVLLDVDDEELGFFRAGPPVAPEADWAGDAPPPLPPLVDVSTAEWTRFAVAMAGEFDGVTVANEPLRLRYGGTIVRHARDFPPRETLATLRDAERERLGIAADRRVVLFLGTPRPHKGLIETATMIARAGCPQAVFLVVGTFADPPLRLSLESVPGIDLRLLGNQPIERLPALVAASDLHVSLLSGGAEVSRFQTPAKLTDALAGGLAVVGHSAPGTADILEGIGGNVATLDELSVEVTRLLHDPEAIRERARAGREWYERHLTVATNARALEATLSAAADVAPRPSRPQRGALFDELLGRMLTASSPARTPGDGIEPVVVGLPAFRLPAIPEPPDGVVVRHGVWLLPGVSGIHDASGMPVIESFLRRGFDLGHYPHGPADPVDRAVLARSAPGDELERIAYVP